MQSIKAVYARDYQAPPFSIEKTSLVFELAEDVTRVTSRLVMTRREISGRQPLCLDGQGLELVSVALDGRRLDASEYNITDEQLVITAVPDLFVLECVVDIHPEKNTSLEGLYRSRGMYCTQCEAEGFRKITYYLDRPDVLSEFETTIVADEGRFPVMLSNGNCIADVVENGRRVVKWHDPFRKPCYLFALVAGNLEFIEDIFVTMSGRDVVLRIFVEEKDLGKCDHAMRSLKKAMRWDEEVYGREYDLDIFMIVAVDDFNMGAMENKGLNIFNTSCVLADPLTTTDKGFERVEAVVAHEYFHNWSGNRVTCRDWFQLSLKEGFTVYRDAEFSADMNSRSVRRVESANFLRTVQFAEDAGPMAHPVRPDSYMEISNFYTVTIYEKGAEVVRMMANLLGRKLFRKGTDLYFSRYDGQAVTCEVFVRCMEEVSGIDLQQFRRWYTQAGTPVLTIVDSYHEKECVYTLRVVQHTAPTPGQPEKLPFHIPLKISLYGHAGALPLKLRGRDADPDTADNTEMVLDVVDNEQVFVFEQVMEKPVPSLLRDFSAPVRIHYPYAHEELARLTSMDSDGFSRWNAGYTLETEIVMARIAGDNSVKSLGLMMDAFRFLLGDESQDPAMLSLMMTMPDHAYLAEQYEVADPGAIHQQLHEVRLAVATSLKTEFLELWQRLALPASGTTARAVGARSLRNTVLSYLMLLEEEAINATCYASFREAQNMTDQLSALKCLVNSTSATAYANRALEDFYRQWQHENLVMNIWLQVQASSVHGNTLARVQQLLHHQVFDYTNPNKVRALIGGFGMQNPSQFHQKDGEGYRFLAGQIAYMDKINPQIAARLVTPLTRWRKIEPVRAGLMRESLQQLMQGQLSRDVFEVVSKSLES